MVKVKEKRFFIPKAKLEIGRLLKTNYENKAQPQADWISILDLYCSSMKTDE